MTVSWTAAIRREVLPNGLTVLVHPDPASSAVAIVTLVRAGFFDEPDEWAGVSHVLEHMFFKGTAVHGPGELARRTKAAGGWLNAGTGYDHTSYYAVLPAAALAEGVALQADAIRNATIDADELRRELQVIIEEAKRKRDTPSAVAHETMHAELFDHHRIRRWRIGEEERLAGFTREDVAGYYRSRYVPSRTIVAVAGGMQPEEALALVREHLGSWAAPPDAIPPGPEEPPRREVRARTLRGDVTQADLVLGWRTVPPLHRDAPSLDLAAAVLSAGRASWLQRALREPGTVMSVAAHHFTPAEVGVFSVSADLDPDRLDAALGGVAATLERLRERGPSQDDLERARTLLLARVARRLESAESRASLMAEAEALDGVGWIDEWWRRISAATAESVRGAVHEWLRPDALAAVAYLPEKRGEDLAADRLRHAFRSRRSRRTTRQAGDTLVLELPAVDLLLRHKPGAGLVTAGLFRPRRTFETSAEAGLGTLAVRTAVRGAGGLDAPALAGAFERLGGSVATSISADHFGFAATVLAEHGVEVMDLIQRVLLEPTLSEAVLAVERETLAQEARHLADDMFRYPFQLALGAAFEDTGYGVPTLGTPDSVFSLTPEQVRRWHATELAEGRSVAVVVGDVDTARLAEALAERLATLPGGARVPRSLPPPRPVHPADAQRMQERQRGQTAIAMVFPGPSRREETRFAAEVWSAAAGGLGGRLFEALRDRRSLAYTVMASSWQRLGAGALLTYIATSPQREEEAREQMLLELARFRREGITDDELQRTISYLTGQIAVGRQTGSAVASELVDRWMAGEPLESFETPEEPYRAVTAPAVLAVLAECLDPLARAEGIVRGRIA